MLLYLDHYEFSRKHHKYRDPQAQQTEDWVGPRPQIKMTAKR
jgi:hypothetical protein